MKMLAIMTATTSLKKNAVEELFIPLSGMWKDVVDTFKPYKSSHQIWRDLYGQTLKGLANFLHGIFYGIFGFSLLCWFVLFSPILLIADPKGSAMAAAEHGLIFISSVAHIIRGITQIAFAPLTWLRMPLRALITKLRGAPKIEDSPALRNLVTRYDTSKDKQMKTAICTVLLTKIMKANARKQITEINISEMIAEFNRGTSQCGLLITDELPIEVTTIRGNTAYAVTRDGGVYFIDKAASSGDDQCKELKITKTSYSLFSEAIKLNTLPNGAREKALTDEELNNITLITGHARREDKDYAPFIELAQASFKK